MEEQDYIMLIMNCKKYLKKAKFQKMTWLTQIPSYLKYYHVIGDETLTTKYVFDHDQCILWVRVPDDYNSLPKKVIRAYEAVCETFRFKYLFKTDDDQILATPHFLNIVANLTKTSKEKVHYGGFQVHVTQNHLSEYYKIHPELPRHLPILKTVYCSGRFYFLSNQAIQQLLTKKETIEQEYLEDYAIGFYLDPCYKRTMVHLETHKYFTDIEYSDFPRWVQEGRL